MISKRLPERNIEAQLFKGPPEGSRRAQPAKSCHALEAWIAQIMKRGAAFRVELSYVCPVPGDDVRPENRTAFSGL